jgi:hypothetical protein
MLLPRRSADGAGNGGIQEAPMYTALVIGAVFTIVLGVPAVVWLTKLLRPPTPEEEKIHRGVEEARRRIDKLFH